MAYVARSQVLYDAGQLHIERLETPTGTVDGANADFYVQHAEIQDRDFDDAVSIDDVQFFVDGSEVTVSTVVAGTGLITLASAPALNSVVKVTYAHSKVDLNYVDDLIEESEDIINQKMGTIVTTPYTTVPPTVRNMTRILSAGFLMSREYGLNALTEETTKEGMRKIKLILGDKMDGSSGLLATYFDQINATLNDEADTDTVRSNTDTRLFEERVNGSWELLQDEQLDLNV